MLVRDSVNEKCVHCDSVARRPNQVPNAGVCVFAHTDKCCEKCHINVDYTGILEVPDGVVIALGV
jgi:hypothetical protein